MGAVSRQLFDSIGELIHTQQQLARAIEALGFLRFAGARHLEDHKHTTVCDARQSVLDFCRKGSRRSNAKLSFAFGESSPHPAVFPPAFLSPCRLPSRPLPAIGVLTSTPFDPKFVSLHTVPSTCFCRCCRSNPECPRIHDKTVAPVARFARSLPAPCICTFSSGRESPVTRWLKIRFKDRLNHQLRRHLDHPSPVPSECPMAAASRLLSVSIASSPVKGDIGLS